jgi:hypothetical protein
MCALKQTKISPSFITYISLRNCRVFIGCNKERHCWGIALVEYTFEMCSGAMIYIPSFIKIGSGIQKLIGGYKDRKEIA